MKYLDKISIIYIALPAIFLAFAPFGSQSHLSEKVEMLGNGVLSEFMDIFDLFWHSVFIVLLMLKILRILQLKYR